MIRHLLRVVHSAIREHTKARSSEWPRVRKAHLVANPTCAACGGTKRPQVHHMDPYHLDPAKELDPSNLITLCMGKTECHLRIGHGDDFKAYNPRVKEDARNVLRNPDKRSAVESQARANRVYEEEAG